MTDQENLAPESSQDELLRGFAGLMGKAEEAARATATESAPYGFTKDEETGELRPKKAAGRPRKSPSLDELKALRQESEAVPPADRLPDERATRNRKIAKAAKEPKSYPAFREGVIEKGVNKLYRKAGKLIKVVDPAIGQALIEITRAEDEDDVTVGKAWEEVARTNPRIRAFLMKMIKGGAWGQLFMAHAPVLLAVVMKDGIREKLPLGNFVEAFLDTSDGESPAEGTPFAGLNLGDAGQMQDLMAMAQDMAGQFMARQQAPRAASESPRSPKAPGADFAEADPFGVVLAAKNAANGQPPPRTQPRRNTRAQRRAK